MPCRAVVQIAGEAFRVSVFSVGSIALLQKRVVSSRYRRDLCGVKRKMSNFPLRPKGQKPSLPPKSQMPSNSLSEQYWVYTP
jgi:hypothetical protein